MENQKSPGNTLLYCFIGLTFICLTVTGIVLIAQSNQMYKHSVLLAEKVLNPPAGQAPLAITPAYTLIRDGYAQALMFFSMALGALFLLPLLPRLQNLSIGPSGITLALRDVQQNLNAVIKQANSIQSTSAGQGGKMKIQGDAEVAPENIKLARDTDDDPQKNKWGGKAENNFRKLSAVVDETEWRGYYKVDITVESTNKDFPLGSIVKFHLHPTFSNPDPVIAVEAGKAVLKLKKVYGAFTVGAEADDGQTKLELDLARIENIPDGFRKN